MTTDRLIRMDDEALGSAIAGLDLAWMDAPATITQDVMDAIAVAERGTVPAVTSVRRRRRVLLLVAAVILALLATAAAARFVLDLRGIIVEQVPGPPLPPESPLAGPELGTPLPLDMAAARAGMEPAYPAALGPPDSVWLVRAGAVLPEGDGGLLAMAWEPGPDLPAIPGTRWGAVLFRFAGSSDVARKMLDPESTVIRSTDVGPFSAHWITGDHELELATQEGAVRVRVTGSVLLWDDFETGWRLETALPQREAIRVAESVDLPGS